ncbi:cobalamin B12-binding domain-containing protein [Litorisediminicola beolgyonensis]|uniref:B12-binding domain-containing protein n=1 Tax=Litorisediminicola beolgyonensis TaxID=1173614 RepID=A0ABW3ZGD2_9RHOB
MSQLYSAPWAGRSEIATLAEAALSELTARAQRDRDYAKTASAAWLADALLSRHEYCPKRVTTALDKRKLKPREIIDDVFPATARRLGELWRTDAITFAENSVASARMQALLVHLAPLWECAEDAPGSGLAVLFTIPEQSHHTLGSRIAEAQLRALGVSLKRLSDPGVDLFCKTVAADPYDAILFSCTSGGSLASVRRMITQARKQIGGLPPTLLGGLVLDHADQICTRAGVTEVSSDPRHVLSLCAAENRRREKATP